MKVYRIIYVVLHSVPHLSATAKRHVDAITGPSVAQSAYSSTMHTASGSNLAHYIGFEPGECYMYEGKVQNGRSREGGHSSLVLHLPRMYGHQTMNTRVNDSTNSWAMKGC